MKQLVILLAALTLGSAAWAQEQKKEEAKPAAEASAPQEKAKPAAAAKKAMSRRHMDARHCLEKGSNPEIIKCAEAYL